MIAARPRIQAIVHDASNGWFITAKLQLMIVTATTFVAESSEQTTAATRSLRKAAVVADQAWQQTFSKNRGPSVGGLVMTDVGFCQPSPDGRGRGSGAFF